MDSYFYYFEPKNNLLKKCNNKKMPDQKGFKKKPFSKNTIFLPNFNILMLETKYLKYIPVNSQPCYNFFQ